MKLAMYLAAMLTIDPHYPSKERVVSAPDVFQLAGQYGEAVSQISSCEVFREKFSSLPNTNMLLGAAAKQPDLRKSEYETEGDAKSRIRILSKIYVGDTERIYTAVNVSRDVMSYDADAGKMRVLLNMMNFSKFPREVTLFSKFTTTGSYVGMTAMGVRKSISTVSYDQLDAHLEFPGNSAPSHIEIPLSSDEARSCPTEWCSFGGIAASISGQAGLVMRPWMAT